MVAGRGANGAQFFCGIAGSQLPLAPAALKPLYANKRDYRNKIERRLNELIRAGWFLPVYKELVLDDAARAAVP
jgi:hypothetical protein